METAYELLREQYLKDLPFPMSISPEEMDKLVNALVLRRVWLRLSQRDLAKLIGTTQPTISDWEKRSYRPKIEPLFRWCAALGIEFYMNFEPIDGWTLYGEG